VYLVNEKAKPAREEQLPLISTHADGVDGLVDHQLIAGIYGTLTHTTHGLAGFHVVGLLVFREVPPCRLCQAQVMQ
jgi:hypothetical protein